MATAVGRTSAMTENESCRRADRGLSACDSVCGAHFRQKNGVLEAGFEPAKLAHGVLNPTPLTNSDTLVLPKRRSSAGAELYLEHRNSKSEYMKESNDRKVGLGAAMAPASSAAPSASAQPLPRGPLPPLRHRGSGGAPCLGSPGLFLADPVLRLSRIRVCFSLA